MTIKNNKALFQFGTNMIRVDKGILLIDEEQGPKINRWFYSANLKREQISGIQIPKENCYHIVASTFKLDGVPLLVIQNDEIQKFCTDFFNMKMDRYEGFDLKPGWRKLVGEAYNDSITKFIEKDLVKIIAKVADDVRKNGFGASSVSRHYAYHWLLNNKSFLQSFLTPLTLNLDIEEIMGDAGIIAHALGECEFKLKVDEKNQIVF